MFYWRSFSVFNFKSIDHKFKHIYKIRSYQTIQGTYLFQTGPEWDALSSGAMETSRSGSGQKQRKSTWCPFTFNPFTKKLDRIGNCGSAGSHVPGVAESQDQVRYKGKQDEEERHSYALTEGKG